MHFTGLAGMPRRVYTYPSGYGWEDLNFASTIGAFLIAMGVALFIVDLARRFRMSSEGNAGNVWNAGTLEWLPNGNYSNRSIPIVASREPLWDQPNLAQDVKDGRYYLPNAPTGGRETIVTSPIEAQPQFLLRMPLPGWAPVIAAWFTAGFFLLLTVKLVVPAVACGAVALAALLHWGWGLDGPPPARHFHVGGGLRLPAYLSGPQSQAWWAVVVLMLVAGSLYACAVFSYLYLWLVSPRLWPATQALPSWLYAAVEVALLAASSAAVAFANRALANDHRRLFNAAIVVGLLLLSGAVAVEFVAQRMFSPSSSAYSASVYLLAGLAGFFAVVVLVLGLFVVARAVKGSVNAVRRVTFDNARLLWHYTVAQTLVGVLLVHGFPRLVN
jgi:cytochrome c oxidase subunit I+III